MSADYQAHTKALESLLEGVSLDYEYRFYPNAGTDSDPQVGSEFSGMRLVRTGVADWDVLHNGADDYNYLSLNAAVTSELNSSGSDNDLAFVEVLASLTSGGTRRRLGYVDVRDANDNPVTVKANQKFKLQSGAQMRVGQVSSDLFPPSSSDGTKTEVNTGYLYFLREEFGGTASTTRQFGFDTFRFTLIDQGGTLQDATTYPKGDVNLNFSSDELVKMGTVKWFGASNSYTATDVRVTAQKDGGSWYHVVDAPLDASLEVESQENIELTDLSFTL